MILKVVLKCAGMAPGAPYVTVAGTTAMLVLYADS